MKQRPPNKPDKQPLSLYPLGFDEALVALAKTKPAHFVGFIPIQGSRAVSLNALLPVHPEKVAIDVDHSLLAIEHQ